MRKSFNKVLAAVLAVLMVVCAFPMTAFAAPGDYEPNIDLQFGTFTGVNSGSFIAYNDIADGSTNKKDDFSTIGLYGPALVYDENAGTLTLPASYTVGYEDAVGFPAEEEDHVYGVGDFFTVSVLLNNVDKVWAMGAYIKYSENIEPAGIAVTTGTASTKSYYIGSYSDLETAIENGKLKAYYEDVPTEEIGSQSAQTWYNINNVVGNSSKIDPDAHTIFAGASNQDGSEYSDISVTEDMMFSNPETGAAPDYDNEVGYTYENTAIIATFAFKIIADGAITFEVDDTDNTKYNAYSGFYYVAQKSDGSAPSTFTTYAIQDGSAGSAKMTFMGKNVNVAAPECSHANTATTENVTAAATCTADGSKTVTVTCNDCGEVVSESVVAIPATGHSYDKVVTAPTCTAEGYTTFTCSVCGDTYKGETVPALGHTNAAPVQENVVNATCDADGSYDEVVYCTVCGAEVSRNTVTVPATGEHVYAEVVDSKDATCTDDGYVTKACGCGATDTTVVPATGHTAADAVVENEVAATCTTDGSYDTVVYCSVCGVEVSRETSTVPATGHTEVTVPGFDATVDAPGLTDGVQCSVCGTWIVPQNEIPMLDSVIVTVIEPDLGNVTGLAYGANKLAKATSYTLTAEALEGAEFLGWAINGKVVSTATTYTSNAVNDVTIEAMFAEAEGSDAITVTFLDKWGNMVATFNGTVADVQAQLAAGIPTASDIVGYSFVGWDMADEDILAITTSATIWAQYEVKADGYTVTTDAELTLPEGVANGAIPYDTSVTVYAEGATAWKIGDVVVAYGDTYTFYVGADVTVVPVFEAVESAPSVTMIKVTETGTGKFQFLATRNVPDGYKLVNAGFVFGRDMTADELTLENVGTVAASGFTVKVGYCSVNGADQFALNYGVSAGNACAKAFVVYKDAAGAINVIYTDMFVG